MNRRTILWIPGEVSEGVSREPTPGTQTASSAAAVVAAVRARDCGPPVPRIGLAPFVEEFVEERA
ncbi:hypothetical protein GCM10027612_71650 [Microbispora bryophytorum subsp. camponoti]